jgi:hypothetical protein
LSIVEKRNIESGSLRIAMHNSQPILSSIMTKGVNALTRDDLATLRERWLLAKPPSGLDASLRADLTRQQRAWLDAHPKIRLGDDFAWPPFSFIDDNDSFSGISAGYLEAMSRRLGIAFLPVQGLSWPEVLKRIKLGKIDALPAVARTPEREEFLRFTKPYITFPVRDHVAHVGYSVSLHEEFDGLFIGFYLNERSVSHLAAQFVDDRGALDRHYFLPFQGAPACYVCFVVPDHDNDRVVGIRRCEIQRFVPFGCTRDTEGAIHLSARRGLDHVTP